MFHKESLKPDEASATHLKSHFTFLFQQRNKYFGNARTVLQVIAEVVKKQYLRLAGMKKEDRTQEMMDTLIFDDVKEFEIKESRTGKPRLGFRVGGE